MLTGNRGEWSEIYALLRLIADGGAYEADLLSGEYSGFCPADRIEREESDGRKISFVCGDPVTVGIVDGAVRYSRVNCSEFVYFADVLYERMVSFGRKGGSFPCPEVESFLEGLGIEKLRAKSAGKHSLQVWSGESGALSKWAVRSALGGSSTLLNPGRATNFCFKVQGLFNEAADSVNAIETKSKIKDRLVALRNLSCPIEFWDLEGLTFEANLKQVGERFPEVLAWALRSYYEGSAKTCMDAVRLLEQEDPLSLGVGEYEHQFKRFLVGVAQGMLPGSLWDSSHKAMDGYVLVTEDGEALVLQAGNEADFASYLLENTRFDTASSSRFGFGSVYQIDGEYFINLNLQIRFI